MKNAEAVDDGAKQIDAFRKTYNAELALRAPNTYWMEKRKGHRKAAAAFSATFIVLAGCSIAILFLIWQSTVAPHLMLPPDGQQVSQSTPAPSYGVFLPTIAVAFLCVWILRIVSRQLLVHLGLASDAGERMAMVQTFLALMQLPEHVKDDDRILILSALFRPSARSDDDATPPNWFDLLMQRLKPTGSR